MGFENLDARLKAYVKPYSSGAVEVKVFDWMCHRYS